MVARAPPGGHSHVRFRTEFALGRLRLRVNWPVAACAAMAAAGFFRLGLWQLDRAGGKVAEHQALQRQSREGAVAIEALPADGPPPRGRHVRLRGEYLNERAILLQAEFFDGQIGYGVATPFRLAGGGALVLVERGWTTGILPPGMPPALRPLAGPVEITGRIHVQPADRRSVSQRVDAARRPLRMRGLDMELAAELLGEPVYPHSVRLAAGQPGALARHWPAVNPDVNRNLSYALQWFGLALLAPLACLLAGSNLWSLMRRARPP